MNGEVSSHNDPCRNLLCAVVGMACHDYLKYYDRQRHGEFISASQFLFEGGLEYYCGYLDLDREYLLNELRGMAMSGERKFSGCGGTEKWRREVERMKKGDVE